MLIFDSRKIGNKLLYFRKRSGLTQMEIAELAGLSDRAYAEIERGNVNMRVDTALRICEALHITPNEILTEKDIPLPVNQKEIFGKLNNCSPKEREAALKILAVYLESISQ